MTHAETLVLWLEPMSRFFTRVLECALSKEHGPPPTKLSQGECAPSKQTTDLRPSSHGHCVNLGAEVEAARNVFRATERKERGTSRSRALLERINGGACASSGSNPWVLQPFALNTSHHGLKGTLRRTRKVMPHSM